LSAKSTSGKKRPAIDEEDEKHKNADSKRLKTSKPRDNLDDYKTVGFDFELKNNQDDKNGHDKDSKKTKSKESNDDLLHYDIFNFEEERKKRKELNKNCNVESERMKTSKSSGNLNKYILDFTKKNTWDEKMGEMEEVEKKKEEKKPNKIDLTKKKNKLTQSPSKSIAMRLDKEDKWTEEFMSLWTKRHSEYAKKIYE
jgi:hypothetical protein